jgi:hypothetical protein
MSKRITGEVKNKEGKVVGKIDYAQPESLQEAAGMF